MRVEVFWIGKTRLDGVAALTSEYSRRLERYCEFAASEVRAGKKKGAGTSEEEAILARSRSSYRVVLDPEGKPWTSPELARFLGKMRDGGQRAITFCVGGAEGFRRGSGSKPVCCSRCRP